MLLAELEVFHSRPIAPTRRVAVGTAVLPTAPAPGFGGLLLSGIVATFIPEVDPDLVDDITRLTHQVEAGQRIVQPRLRHRLQDDRVGLTKCPHRLIGTGEELRFELGASASPEPNVLAARALGWEAHLWVDDDDSRLWLGDVCGGALPGDPA